MAKKATERKPKTIRHARIELPEEDYLELEQVAHRIGLGISAYIRMVVLKSVREANEGRTN
jgi:hypothetical protein